MRSSARKFTAVAAASAVLAGVLTGLTAEAASARPDCADISRRTYTEMASSWYKVVASGTIDNRDSPALVRDSAVAAEGARLKGEVSGEIGGSLGRAVAEINAMGPVTVEAEASFPKGWSKPLTVPAGERLSYRVGIKQRTYQVQVTRQFSSCVVVDSWAEVTVPDRTVAVARRSR
ncbi:hypothetical protein SZN_08399 [Streptomyces zinciresistens K42]|uniref:Secreted protein n=1 Tax=Streptomyces zinciresistens K42 TaxID=700597 RepID=G2G866_9ACTN|nr:hypothetical protein [Streptomyces zinciresistens]EGX60354.1 hypothetical protein SZN_08399 [Streptomyces zinciresistens K42]